MIHVHMYIQLALNLGSLRRVSPTTFLLACLNLACAQPRGSAFHDICAAADTIQSLSNVLAPMPLDLRHPTRGGRFYSLHQRRAASSLTSSTGICHGIHEAASLQTGLLVNMGTLPTSMGRLEDVAH